MKKINIKGNDYVMAHERVMEFHRLYKNGSIVTDIVEMTDRFITITKVTPDVDKPERYFTGIAYEDVTSTGVNSTSALENCETSSCARSLGFLNIGIDTSIASAEEVSNAIHQQSKPVKKPDAVAQAEKTFGKENIVAFPETDNVKTINFGKHKGNSWAEVPEDYMQWLITKGSVEWQKEEAQQELNRRNQDSQPKKVVGGMSEAAFEKEELEKIPF